MAISVSHFNNDGMSVGSLLTDVCTNVRTMHTVPFPVRCTLPRACLVLLKTVRQNNSEHKDETASKCTQPVPLRTCDTQTTLCAHCSKTLPAPFRPTTGGKGEEKKRKRNTFPSSSLQVHRAHIVHRSRTRPSTSPPPTPNSGKEEESR